jgi:hypothetical protein
VRPTSNRKQFLAAVAAGAALSFKSSASAEPSAPPSPSPTEKPPSEAALALAATMRRFDPKLNDAEITTIARGIDEGARFGAALNPKKKRLRNWDEPVTTFVLP